MIATVIQLLEIKGSTREVVTVGAGYMVENFVKSLGYSPYTSGFSSQRFNIRLL